MTLPPPSAPIDGDDGDDDEALRWAGDDDRGQVAPSRRRIPVPASEGDFADEAMDDAPAPARPVRSVLTAIFALVYLALTVGWIIGVQNTSSGTTDLATEVLWQFGEFTAIIAAPLWFGAATSLTRDSATAARIGWLALGAGVLIPWPAVFRLLSLGVA
ncbi:MAG TPA: hypothetical protein VNT53_08430 [Pseudolysinimonas sp.]|nr:hypothetical protein [Pseudolysinimonas sp.]